MRIGSLFSGYGGLDIGVTAAIPDSRVVWHSEIDNHAARVLKQHWPHVPNYGDITKVDWSSVEPVDILTGGFPCQDVSKAGKLAGIKAGTRSGLWRSMAEAVGCLQPSLVIIENVRGLLSAEASSDLEPCQWCVGDRPAEPVLRALGAVLGDLTDLGFDATWATFRAADVGACHRRERVFIVAHPADAEIQRLQRGDGFRSGSGQPEGSLRCGSDAAADTNVASSETWFGAGHHGGRPREQLVGSTALATNWGPYADAVHRWEGVLGRQAPAPTENGANGKPRLSSYFVEWMMGLPEGHVTRAGIPRTAQLQILGNGCVPQQVAYAVNKLLRNYNA